MRTCTRKKIIEYIALKVPGILYQALIITYTYQLLNYKKLKFGGAEDLQQTLQGHSTKSDSYVGSESQSC